RERVAALLVVCLGIDVRVVDRVGLLLARFAGGVGGVFEGVGDRLVARVVGHRIEIVGCGVGVGLDVRGGAVVALAAARGQRKQRCAERNLQNMLHKFP